MSNTLRTQAFLQKFLAFQQDVITARPVIHGLMVATCHKLMAIQLLHRSYRLSELGRLGVSCERKLIAGESVCARVLWVGEGGWGQGVRKATMCLHARQLAVFSLGCIGAKTDVIVRRAESF